MSQIARDLNLMDSHIRIVNWRNLRHLDWLVVVLVAGLAYVGLSNMYSASYGYEGAEATPHFARQALFLGIGALVALIIVCIDYRFLAALAPLMYIGALAALLAVLTIGLTVKGGRSWFRIGTFGLQPSEYTKLATIYMLAWYLAKIGPRIRRIPYLVLAFLIAAVPSILIAAQSDMGTALTYVPVAFVMVFVAGCRKWHLAAIILVGLAIVPVLWMRLEPYQRDRVKTFIDPTKAPDSEGYQIIQTKIAVGSGQMWGKGVGHGTQTHLRFLPEYRTDFIFSLLAEERGFVGAAVVIALFTAFLIRGLVLSEECPEPAGNLLAAGCVTILAFHVFVNVAITIHLMPITGLPLPFLSYGGSFYLTTMMCVGTMLSVNVRKGMFAEK
ncbi:MAG TPA: rod shape-determining protein RodA [Candidatus Hydrogenedentes bacterium]|nr:rod shape-determining protein RodA [Candidatus Hydrogenedentota bacterium]HQE82441.1 rod shape-determining protein RodA [Candidatus Hydrogenedentota bacterium]HQH52386.1 rod shape-determining protein RodA [Candidatus Hydrogenedentota bacterium]HQM49899.1 rod shape-determining protein RodA [Candidatus Hydrogenedentota bacterium]